VCGPEETLVRITIGIPVRSGERLAGFLEREGSLPSLAVEFLDV
jgi:hypothetical protein